MDDNPYQSPQLEGGGSPPQRRLCERSNQQRTFLQCFGLYIAVNLLFVIAAANGAFDPVFALHALWLLSSWIPLAATLAVVLLQLRTPRPMTWPILIAIVVGLIGLAYFNFVLLWHATANV